MSASFRAGVRGQRARTARLSTTSRDRAQRDRNLSCNSLGDKFRELGDKFREFESKVCGIIVERNGHCLPTLLRLRSNMAYQIVQMFVS